MCTQWELTTKVFSLYDYGHIPYMVFCITFRCEEEAKEHQASQRAIADELEEKQAHCVQLRATSEAFQGQLLEAEENKKKVGREIFLDKGL